MPIQLSLALFVFLMRKSPCGSLFKFSRGFVVITLSMEVLEPRMNALLNCLTTWWLCLHISLSLHSMFYASRVQLAKVFSSRVAWDLSRVSWPDFFSQLFTQLFPGIARFSCPLILCLTLNFGRTMLASQRQNLLRGSSSLPVRVSSGFSDASYSACIALEESDPELIFHQNWSESVRRSTWRELKAVCLALVAFWSPLHNQSKVFWYSDNHNV